MRDSRQYKVTIEHQVATGESLYLVSNDKLEGYRCTTAHISPPTDGPLCISTELAQALQIDAGAVVRVVPLFGPRI